MKYAVPFVIALAPTAALANFDCTILQQCGGGTCESFDGGPLLMREVGDVWQVSLAGQTWEGYAITTFETAAEMLIVVPSQNGMSGLISVYPSGEVTFTAHAFGDGPVAISGSGNCRSVGG